MTEEERKTYCKNCDRSIYATGILARSCDNNIADNGYFNLAGDYCSCKIVDGVSVLRAKNQPNKNMEKLS